MLVAEACDVPHESSSSDSEWVVSSFPADGDRDVSRLERMEVELDRRVHPNSVHRGSVEISSGVNFSWLSAYFDLVTQKIVIGLNPDYPLRPYVTYRLSIRELVDLDGNTQPESHQVIFRTGSRTDVSIAWPRVEWSEVQRIFSKSCSGASCHGGSTPAMGLDLSNATRIEQTAIGAFSRELPTHMVSAEGARGSYSLLAFRIIDVGVINGRPASSYMMYKLLDDSHIVGNAMPHPDAKTGQLEREKLEAISTWILFGAVMQPESE